ESKDSLAHGPGGYIGGAELEISSGASAGRKTIADLGGFFRIDGLQAPGFDVTVREAGYSSKRFHVSELGRDLSSETILTPSPTMMSGVLEGRSAGRRVRSAPRLPRPRRPSFALRAA